MIIMVLFALIILWANLLLQNSQNLSKRDSDLCARSEKVKSINALSSTVEKQHQELSEKFNKEKCVGAIILQVKVESFAKEAGLNVSLSSTNSKPSGDYIIHSIAAKANLAQLPALAKFEREISLHAPYISISKVSYDSRGQGEVSANYTISSFEPRK